MATAAPATPAPPAPKPKQKRAKSEGPRNKTDRIKAGMTAEEVAAIQKERKENRAAKKKAYNAKVAAKKPADAPSAWDHLSDAEKQRRKTQQYIRDHSGETPKYNKAKPAALKKHGVAYVAPPPLVIPADQVQARRQVVIAPTPAADVPQYDPKEPTSWTGFLGFIERSSAIKATTKPKYTAAIKRVLMLAYDMTEAELEACDDVAPLLLNAPEVLAAVPKLRLTKRSAYGVKGDPLTKSNLVNVYRALRFPITDWPRLKPNQATKNKYEAAYSAAQRDAVSEKESRPAIKPEDFNDIIAAVHNQFGPRSPESTVIDAFTEAPIRAEMGSLKIVNTDADMRHDPHDKTQYDPNDTTNYLVKEHAGEGGRMAIVLNQYKNEKGRGSSTHALSAEHAGRVVNEWLAAHPENEWLFTKARSKGKEPIGNAAMSKVIKAMLVKALPPKAHASLVGQAVNALRKSWASTVTGVRANTDADIDAAIMNHSKAVHDRDYVRPLRIKDIGYDERVEESTPNVAPAKTGRGGGPTLASTDARDVARKMKKSAPKRPASRPQGPQAPASSAGAVANKPAHKPEVPGVIEDSDDENDTEVEQVVRRPPARSHGSAGGSVRATVDAGKRTQDPTLKAKLKAAITARRALDAVRASSRAGRGTTRRYG